MFSGYMVKKNFLVVSLNAIVHARAEKPITTTLQLAEIIKFAIPKPKKPQDKHPATRSFQAIRIAVNRNY